MAHPVSRTTVAGLAVAISLSIPSWTPAQPASTSSTTSRDALSDAQIRSELRRLNTVKTDCLAQAQQAVAAQKAATEVGRLSEAEAHGRIVKSKMACADKANQDVLRLQTQAGPARAALFTNEDRFHQEYRQGLQACLGTLQRFNGQLASQDTVQYEVFARQMDTFRQQLETFKNRYIRLLNEAETRELAQTLFQASDLLIASAQTWKQQLKAEAEMADLIPRGPSPQLSRAQATRDAALKERTNQWESAQRLITQARGLAATR